MKNQTVQRWVSLGLGLLCMVSMGASSMRADSGSRVRPVVRISVYNDVGLKRATLLRAEEDAGAVFRRAGIETEWKNCGGEEVFAGVGRACNAVVAYPERLVLRIERRPRGLVSEPLGVAYLADDGKGVYCDVFVEPMEELQQVYAVSLDSLLGHVAAHEIAHLLLGLHSHSAGGLMRARWGLQTMEELKRSGLEFNSTQAAVMVERLELAQDGAPDALVTMAGNVPATLMALPTQCPNSH
jgi:hypothetical protein